MVDNEEAASIAAGIIQHNLIVVGINITIEKAYELVNALTDKLFVTSEDCANELLKLMETLECADVTFKSCQSESFRQQVRSIYTAPNIQNAYDDLRAQIIRIRANKVPP
jgi:hypothetical protein